VNCNDKIFYFEALCALCALLNTCTYQSETPGRFVIYTDSFNTINIFFLLNVLPSYNILLQEVVNLLYKRNHGLPVLHIPKKQNTVADALSHTDFDHTLALQPNLLIYEFEPY